MGQKSSLERKANAIGLGLLERALELEPNYATALAMAAWCHAQRCVYRWTDDPDTESRLTLQLANKAVKLAANDSFALSMLGAAQTLVREFDTAYELLQRALELDPGGEADRAHQGGAEGCFERGGADMLAGPAPQRPME